VDFIGTGSVTVSMWLFPLGGIIPRVLSNGKFEIRYLPATKILQATSDGATLLSSTGVVLAGFWTHLTVTRSADGATIIYLNGVQVASGTTGTPVAGTTNITLGHIAAGAPATFAYKGIMDDVRVYDKIFTPAETRALYHDTIPKTSLQCDEMYGGIKVFRVYTTATQPGDGVYYCQSQHLDKDQWADTAGDEKFVPSSYAPTTTEVLNVLEYHPEGEYVRQLEVGDMLFACRMYDDESNARWFGYPAREGAHGPRIAYCKDDAGAAQTIACYLDKDAPATATEIPVYCHSAQGNSTNLNACIPRLADGDPIMVQKLKWYDTTAAAIVDRWVCTTVFQPSEDCVCT